MEKAKGDGFTTYKDRPQNAADFIGNMVHMELEMDDSRFKQTCRSTPNYDIPLHCFCIKFMMEM